MATVDPRTVYDYLVNTHGVSTASAAGILANIQFESSFNPSAVGDNGTSGGLFQHHAGRWDRLRSFAQNSGRRWYDWRAQVDFAVLEANERGISLQQTDAAAASKEWTLRFEIPANAQVKAVQRAAVVSRYQFGDDTPVGSKTTPSTDQPIRRTVVRTVIGAPEQQEKISPEERVAAIFRGRDLPVPDKSRLRSIAGSGWTPRQLDKFLRPLAEAGLNPDWIGMQSDVAASTGLSAESQLQRVSRSREAQVAGQGPLSQRFADTLAELGVS